MRVENRKYFPVPSVWSISIWLFPSRLLLCRLSRCQLDSMSWTKNELIWMIKSLWSSSPNGRQFQRPLIIMGIVRHSKSNCGAFRRDMVKDKELNCISKYLTGASITERALQVAQRRATHSSTLFALMVEWPPRWKDWGNPSKRLWQFPRGI